MTTYECIGDDEGRRRRRRRRRRRCTHVHRLGDGVVGLADGQRVDVDAVCALALLLYELELLYLLSVNIEQNTRESCTKIVITSQVYYLMSILAVAAAVASAVDGAEAALVSPSSDDDEVRLVRKFFFGIYFEMKFVAYYNVNLTSSQSENATMSVSMLAKSRASRRMYSRKTTCEMSFVLFSVFLFLFCVLVFIGIGVLLVGVRL